MKLSTLFIFSFILAVAAAFAGEGVTFKFENSLPLLKPEADSKEVVASITVQKESGDRKEVNYVPGRRLKNQNGCVLSKLAPNDVDKTAVTGGAKGNIWEIRLLKKVRGPKESKLSGNFDNIWDVETRTYFETFQIKNQDGVTLQLDCQSTCMDGRVLFHKMSCNNGISSGTDEILEWLGVDHQRVLELVPEAVETSSGTPATPAAGQK